MFIYIFGSIWLYFGIFSGDITMRKKYQNIAKYIQIYTNIYKMCWYILVYIFVYIFGIFSAWLWHLALYGPRPYRN